MSEDTSGSYVEQASDALSFDGIQEQDDFVPRYSIPLSNPIIFNSACEFDDGSLTDEVRSRNESGSSQCEEAPENPKDIPRIGDISSACGLKRNSVEHVLKMYGRHTAKFQYDKAREVVEEFRLCLPQPKEPIQIHLDQLLKSIVDLAEFDRRYYMLSFMSSRGLFRKESLLRCYLTVAQSLMTSEEKNRMAESRRTQISDRQSRSCHSRNHSRDSNSGSTLMDFSPPRVNSVHQAMENSENGLADGGRSSDHRLEFVSWSDVGKYSSMLMAPIEEVEYDDSVEAQGIRLMRHLLSQCRHYVLARTDMILFYQVLSQHKVNGVLQIDWDLINEKAELVNNSLKKCNHPQLTAVAHQFTEELEVLCMLVQSQMKISKCRMFGSLSQLKQLRERFEFWIRHMISPNSLKKVNLFNRIFASDNVPKNRIISWLINFYNFMMAKFSLYFTDVLGTFCSANDLRAIQQIDNQFNFIQKFREFCCKTGSIVFTGIVMDREKDEDEFYGFGYYRDSRDTSVTGPKEGVDAQFPFIFKFYSPINKNWNRMTLKERWRTCASSLINKARDAANSTAADNNDKSIVFYDHKKDDDTIPMTWRCRHLEGDLYTVVGSDSLNGGDKTTINAFLQEIVPTLNGSKRIAVERPKDALQIFPHDIDRYRACEELLLSMNHIKELPKALFKLTRLRMLDLSDNDINGVPSDIHHLVNLVELNLSRNDISDMPEQIRFCPALMILDLSSNPITRLPETICQISSLTHLGLYDVTLTQLPTDLGQLINLRSLEVRDNLIRALPPSICQLKNLQVLDLGQNEIDELPSNVGLLENLRELYIDVNDLETLPDQITRCSRLEQLDVSENKLATLPNDFGDLDRLQDVNLSQNLLQILPNSIGRLRKLSILRLEKNTLTSLTSAIGQCDQLTELFLTENLLTELPESIGALKNLKNLNADKNQLTAVPLSIGGCVSLTLLSLRENKLQELPMEIGKCERLVVLDLCNNLLQYLPFTINVLFKLTALWLSENQSQAMPRLQQTRVRGPKGDFKVLTCYLLPQHSQAHSLGDAQERKSNFLGGPKVHFPDQEQTIDEEKLPIGQFERHDTPKPKSQKDKLKKSSIDGHVIPHEGPHDATLALTRKSSDGPSSGTEHHRAGDSMAPQPAPRSALKHTSIPPTQYEPEGTSTPVREISGQGGGGGHVAFAVDDAADDGAVTRLRRINTPHYKGVRGVIYSGSGSTEHRNRNDHSFRSGEQTTMWVRRDSNGGLGMSIAGGLGSTPYKEGDSGLFISRLTSGGPAELSGLRVGDKLIRVNQKDVLNVKHDVAVDTMKEAKDVVELVIRREGSMEPTVERNQTIEHTLDVSFMSDAADFSSLTHDTISTNFKRDSNGSPGFSIAGGLSANSEAVFISSISHEGVAAKNAKLAVGDRVLSINGTKMNGVRHDQAVALLTGLPHEDIFLVLQRDKRSVLSDVSAAPTANSSISTPNTTLSPVPSRITRSVSQSVPINQLGNTSSWDGKTESVELQREGKCLGLSVVGGNDHSSHPFGILQPGVFISKITANSPAARCQRLRIGDRIMSVNETDVSKAKHRDAVEALKHSGSRVRLVVIHDKQPAGLREVFVRRAGDQPLGLSIHGGVGHAAANPLDHTDEGIFIDKVDAGSVAEEAGLQAGDRLIEVNGEALLGANQLEAARALKSSGELRILLCDGYNVEKRRDVGLSTSQSVLSSTAENDSAFSSSTSHPMSPIMNEQALEHEEDQCNGDDISHSISAESKPLMETTPAVSASLIPRPSQNSRHSQIPSSTDVTKPSRIPPPVAPKPLLKPAMPPLAQENMNPNPEKLSFVSKLAKFESESVLPQRPASKAQPPEKRPLLSEEDMRILKESEAKKLNNLSGDVIMTSEHDDDFYDHLLREEPLPGGGSIRTKNAETRARSAGILPPQKPMTDEEKRSWDLEKRREWREARMRSLAQEKADADAIMDKLRAVTPMEMDCDIGFADD